MPTVKVKDAELYYEEHGRGEPLVLVPGFGTGLWIWYRQVPAFAERFPGEADDLPYKWPEPDDLPPPPVPDALESALQPAASEERPLILFDTYEVMTAIGNYLRRGLLPSLPEQAIIVIGSRRPTIPRSCARTKASGASDTAQGPARGRSCRSVSRVTTSSRRSASSKKSAGP